MYSLELRRFVEVRARYERLPAKGSGSRSKKTRENNKLEPPFRFDRAGKGCSRNVDENRSLPYKPRQLSAMARSDRGRFIWAENGLLWAGQHQRTYLIIRQIVSLSGKLSAENGP